MLIGMMSVLACSMLSSSTVVLSASAVAIYCGYSRDDGLNVVLVCMKGGGKKGRSN